MVAKREAEPGFSQIFNGNVHSNNFECNAQGTCNSGIFNTLFRQTYNGPTNNNNFDYSGRRKRSLQKLYKPFNKLNKREAVPGFSQIFNGNVQSNNYECNVQGTCNSGIFNTLFRQTYNGPTTNNNYDYSGRRKRSLQLKNSLNKREAVPGFSQIFNGHVQSNNYECNAHGTCNRGIFDTKYDQFFNGQTIANNFDFSG